MCQITPLSRKFEQVVKSYGKKFKFPAQGNDLAPFVGNGTKKKHFNSEI
jgi:hypothetical protein